MAEQEATRIQVMTHLQRINRALAAWDVWEWNARLPEAFQRELERPPLTPEQLKRIRRTLLRNLRRPTLA